MIKTLYSVFDNVAKVFTTPFEEINDSTAVRGFEYAQKNKNSLIGLAPEDFTLYAVGGFNDETGEFVSDDLAFPRKVADGKSVDE